MHLQKESSGGSLFYLHYRIFCFDFYLIFNSFPFFRAIWPSERLGLNILFKKTLQVHLVITNMEEMRWLYIYFHPVWINQFTYSLLNAKFNCLKWKKDLESSYYMLAKLTRVNISSMSECSFHPCIDDMHLVIHDMHEQVTEPFRRPVSERDQNNINY